MGLDAFVRCNCFKDGKCATPPATAEQVRFEEDGSWEVILPDGPEGNRVFQQMMAWEKDACTHENMELYSCRVGNWYGVGNFKYALCLCGEGHFPVLMGNIPSNNGGCLPYELAGQALQELELFQELVKGCDGLFLTDGGTGETIFKSSGMDGMQIAWLGKYVYGFDENGFYIQDRIAGGSEGGEERFRSMEFYQRPQPALGEKASLYTDLATGKDIHAEMLVGSEPYPAKIRLVKRPMDKSDFAYIIDSLKQLLSASLATGNPIIWC